MSKKIKWLSCLLLLLLCSLCCSCQKKVSEAALTERTNFDAYLDRLFITLASSDTLTLNYTLADPSNYQISIDVPTLGEFSVESMQNDLTLEQHYMTELLTYDYDLLTEDQQLTYDLLKENFELDLKYSDYILYNEILGPTTGLQAQLPILLAEYSFYSAEDIDNYIALIADTERYFNQICEFERLKSKAGLFMSDAVADSIIEQCEAFISNADSNYLIEYFDEKIDAFSGLTDAERDVYKTSNKENILNYLIPAYENLISTLEDCKGTGTNNQGLCYYKNGQAYYEYLVCSTTGSSKSIETLASMLDEALTSSLMDMAACINADPDILNKLNNYKYVKTEPTEILSYLKEEILTDFPALPQVNCSIKYVHESLQDYLSPAMYLIPALDNYTENSIYINANPLYDLSELFTTIAHEGYPGHLYQCVYYRSRNLHPIRNMIHYTGYEEGWATYAELYSYSIAGLDDSVAKILEDNMVATHCIYSRTDIGIHYEGWTYADVSDYLTQFVSEESCAIIYNTLLEEPALYLPYSIGYLEIMNLKETAQNALGDKFNLKEFHTFLLNIGPASFDIIEDRMADWIKEQ